MKGHFKAKVSRFGSLISLIAIFGMLVLFALALPEFFSSGGGRVFAGVWAVLAIAVIWAHMARFSEERRRRYISPFLSMKPEERARKDQRSTRVMRG